METVIQNSYLIPLLPLIGAAVAGFLGAKWLKGLSHWPIWLGVGTSAVLSLTLLVGMLIESHKLEAGESHEARAAEATHAEPGRGDAKPKPFIGIPVKWYTWISAGDPSKQGTPAYFEAEAGAWFDPLTAVMLCVVCGIGLLICIFAAGYMKGEEGYFRFFAYLGLFIFMMTLLVMGNNLIVLYLGWEGVGLCSYLLIGYYYEKPSAREAAKKAFLVNRVGDFGFGIGIMLCFLAFGTVSYYGQGVGTHTGLLEMARDWAMLPREQLSAFQQQALQWIPFCLMLGAFGKSAQFPLHVWLPDAMEGPTPVSALIHAATMVTAGVYMIARCGSLFVGNAHAQLTIAAIGAFTALMAATIALRQFDLKKVFAYSTISQLGYMFVAVGVLAPVAGVFHLVTHAFFKALLFLSSGVVMHAMAGVLDMREMSGLKRVLPKTRILMLIGCLALAGMVPFSGFFSKDEIISGIFGASSLLGTGQRVLLGLVMLFTAFLTAYYTFRLYFRVFEGPEVIPQPPPDGHGHDSHGADAHADDHGHDHKAGHDHHHNHEPAIMIVPLYLLAAGAIVAGIFNFPFEWLGDFLGKSPSAQLAFQVADHYYGGVQGAGFGQGEGSVNIWLMLVSTVIAASGIGLAYWLHLKDRGIVERWVREHPGLPRVLEAKYWIDEIYQNAIVEPLRTMGRWFFGFDRFLIDGLIAVVSWVPQLGGWILKLFIQRGSLQGYAAAMLFGIVIILLVVFYGH